MLNNQECSYIAIEGLLRPRDRLLLLLPRRRAPVPNLECFRFQNTYFAEM